MSPRSGHRSGDSLLWSIPTSSFLTCIFNAFNRSNVRYCVLRNYEGLPNKVGNDLDIFVHPQDVLNAVAIVDKVAFEGGWAIARRMRRYHYTASFYYDRKSLRTLLIDIYSGITFKGMTVVATDWLLEARQRNALYYFASLGCEAAVSMTKELFMFCRIKENDKMRSRINRGVTNDRDGFVKALENALGREESELLADKAGRGHWNAVEERCSRLRKKLIWRSLASEPTQQLARWISFVWRHVLQKLQRKTGFFIVFIGADGSGKTTLVRHLVSCVGETQFFKEFVYLHKDFRILPELKKIKQLWLPGTENGRANHGVAIRTGMVAPHALGRSLVYLFYYLLDSLLGHVVIVRARGKQCMVVADRYFYDFFYQRNNSNLPWWLVRLLARLVPRPDILICLAGDPMVLSLRKPDLSVAEIARENDIIMRISSAFKGSELVNTEADPNDVARRVCITILHAMAKQAHKS